MYSLWYDHRPVGENTCTVNWLVGENTNKGWWCELKSGVFTNKLNPKQLFQCIPKSSTQFG